MFFVSKSKKIIKSIAIALVLALIAIPVLNSASAMELTEDSQIIEQTEEVIQPRLGGGPSPSAAWTYKRSYRHTFKAYQLDNLSSKYQGIMNSSNYKMGKKAYDASITALGYMGAKGGGALAANILSWFGKTYHSEIQRSANVLASAASKNKSVTLRIKEYVRPASREKMILYY